MHGTAVLEQPQAALPPQESQPVGEPGRLLAAIFATLDRAGIGYCVLHGYDDFPRWPGSDVDCIIDSQVPVGRVAELLARSGPAIGAEVIRCKGSHIVLARREERGARFFLTLDLSADCALDDVVYCDGDELIESRRRRECFWIPAARLEFGCYLALSVAKGRLDGERAGRLGRLFREDAAGCEAQAARLSGRRSAGLIVAAARSGDWRPVRQCLPQLRTELRRRAMARRPARFVAGRLRGLLHRARRALRPDGVYVAVLGPDGAGKSSLIEALETNLGGAFAGSVCYGFTPALIHHLRHGPYRENSAPHALPPRSALGSVARALGYWLPYYTLSYPVRHLDLARSRLVLADRHLADALVDPKRYRYGGPMWLVRLIWRVVPKPDLVVLLDAPAEVLQARKRDVPFEETARQRRDYLALVRGMPNGHVVDAAQPLEHVAAEVGDLILRQLRAGTERRLRVS
jgi:thymidylate kinase